MPRPGPKAFRLSPTELNLLAALAERMNCSEADVIRWGMAALGEIHRDGLRSATETLPHTGKRRIGLEDARSRVGRFWEQDDGSFQMLSWSVPYWGDEEPED